MATTTREDEEGWGPTVGGRARRRRPRLRLRPGRWLRRLVALVLIALLALGAWVYVQIPREPVDGLAASGRPLHVLVTGSDSREGLTDQDQRDLTTGRGDGIERTDTIFVMTIDGGRVGLLAFPRDLWVTRCDGTTGRINAAVQLGGTSCLVDTVRRVSGIPVQHHLRITFGGFRDVVDAVDGVELCLEDAIADRDAGIDLPAGCQTLDGTDALGYVRVRKIDNDLQRIQRQQRFVRALADELVAPSNLLNPVRLVSLSGSVGSAVRIDDAMGPIAMARLARGLRGLAAGQAVTETVPSTIGAVGNASVLFVDDAAAGPVFSGFASGSVLGRAGLDVIDPSEVPVRVLNGTGVSGLAGQVAELLEARGYPIVEVGNTDARDETVIRHPAAQEDGARTLAAEIPGEVRLERADVPDVTVLLGRDAAGGR